MNLYHYLQRIDGERLAESFFASVPPMNASFGEVEAHTATHMQKILQVPPLQKYVGSVGMWALQQIETGEFSANEAQVFILGVMSTTAALIDYADQDQ